MLNYSNQLSIARGIFYCFNNKTDKKLLTIKYSEKIFNQDQKLLSYKKYESFIKEDFVITCLYLMIKYKPSSINKLYSLLKDIDFHNDILPFKTKIINYKIFIKKDLDYITENYGNISLDNLLSLYKRNIIQFYTVWFIFKNRNISIENYIEKNRINGIHLSYIKQIMLYITFSEKAYEYVNAMLNDSSSICESFIE